MLAGYRKGETSYICMAAWRVSEVEIHTRIKTIDATHDRHRTTPPFHSHIITMENERGELVDRKPPLRVSPLLGGQWILL